MNNLRINFCLNDSLLDKVKNLSDLNKSTLGMLPYSVIDKASERKQIICACDEQNNLYGYLLFNISKNRVKIVHFCVNASFRGAGIARKIFDFLENNTNNGILSGLTLSCRRDYNLQPFLKSLGFYSLGDRNGRGKRITKLTDWFKSYPQNDLLIDVLKPDEDKISVVLDTCILLDLHNEDESVSSLFSDWLGNSLEYMVTQEAFNDVDNCIDDDLRLATMDYVKQYKRIDSLDSALKQSYVKKLKALFVNVNDANRRNTESDINHIAISAEHNVDYFVTRDRGLLSKKGEIYRIANIEIVTPQELIDKTFDNEIDYNPKKLHSLNLQKRKIPLEDVKDIFQQFLLKDEKLLDICNQISDFSNEPEKVERILIYREGKNHLFAVKINSLGNIALKFLRTAKGPISDSLLYEFLSDIISSLKGCDIYTIVIEDRGCIGCHFDLISKLGFVIDSNGFMKKYVINSVISLEKLFLLLKSENFDSRFDAAVDMAIKKRTISSDDYLEHLFYPLLIDDSDITYYIIPIKYIWAMELFQKNYAKDDCIGVHNQNLIISRENVYYSASTIKNIDLPARIFWYTSKQKGGFSSMEISAVSKIDSFERGDIKTLFKKNEKYGVFKWSNIINLSNSGEKEVIAIKFFDTFLLPKVIKLKELEQIGINAPQSIAKLTFEQKRKLLAKINEK